MAVDATETLTVDDVRSFLREWLDSDLAQTNPHRHYLHDFQQYAMVLDRAGDQVSQGPKKLREDGKPSPGSLEPAKAAGQGSSAQDQRKELVTRAVRSGR